MFQEPAEVWNAFFNDPVMGARMRAALSFIAMTPLEEINKAITRIDHEVSIGPFRDPTAYLDGKRFRNSRDYMEVLKAVRDLRKILKRIQAEETARQPLSASESATQRQESKS